MEPRRCVVACMIPLLAACACGDVSSARGRAARASAASGDRGAAGAPPREVAADTDFGNPSASVEPLPIRDARADAGATDAGPCVVGQFCPPTEPDPDHCGTLRLEPDVKITRSPGNMLVIFDQSASMDQPWGVAGSKLQAANNALVQALTPLQDWLTVGAIFFPTVACIPFFATPPGGAVEPIEGPNQIPFQSGPEFLNAWRQHWATRFIGGIGTPMQEAFDRADLAIQSATLSGELVVVAFTDGEPNCFPDPAITMAPTMVEPDRAADWLASSTIKTYMVGLPGAQGVAILNQVAQSGGTMQYILPDDPMQLEMKLREVLQETIKTGFEACSMNLTPAANPPDELLMIVDENGLRQQVPHDAGGDSGWTISDDGTHVEIFGRLCEDAKTGRFSSITFEYGCPEAPPPPRLPPVE
ncbi:MAG: VWA domain-containing protein [Myxococcales bacterium]|nr:VWA domain-containing protein [Myxococcales bacterium]